MQMELPKETKMTSKPALCASMWYPIKCAALPFWRAPEIALNRFCINVEAESG